MRRRFERLIKSIASYNAQTLRILYLLFNILHHTKTPSAILTLVETGGARRLPRHGQEVRLMLVITRREGEEVVIGDPRNPIGVVRIAGIRGDRVRVAFDFPRQVDVHRREIAQQILDAHALEASADSSTIK